MRVVPYLGRRNRPGHLLGDGPLDHHRFPCRAAQNCTTIVLAVLGYLDTCGTSRAKPAFLELAADEMVVGLLVGSDVGSNRFFNRLEDIFPQSQTVLFTGNSLDYGLSLDDFLGRSDWNLLTSPATAGSGTAALLAADRETKIARINPRIK